MLLWSCVSLVLGTAIDQIGEGGATKMEVRRRKEYAVALFPCGARYCC